MSTKVLRRNYNEHQGPGSPSQLLFLVTATAITKTLCLHESFATIPPIPSWNPLFTHSAVAQCHLFFFRISPRLSISPPVKMLVKKHTTRLSLERNFLKKNQAMVLNLAMILATSTPFSRSGFSNSDNYWHPSYFGGSSPSPTQSSMWRLQPSGDAMATSRIHKMGQ